MENGFLKSKVFNGPDSVKRPARFAEARRGLDVSQHVHHPSPAQLQASKTRMDNETTKRNSATSAPI
jgi:hypothetical protein